MRIFVATALAVLLGLSSAEAQSKTEGASIPTLSANQTSEILRTIRAAGIAPEAKVDFEVKLGVKVPQYVTLLPLPLRAIQLLPQFEGYLFFLLPDGRAPIISPTTLQIVDILR
ncbi:MAG: hypothetical protein ABIQ30_11830 [Devosia sp.]